MINQELAQYELKFLDEADHDAFDNFLLKFPQALLFHSCRYISLIAKMVNGKARFLTVKCGGNITGVLGYVEKETEWGLVVNSTPYYGSNGGIFSADVESTKLLGMHWEELSKTAAAATYITTPLMPFQWKPSQSHFVVKRRTHINALPSPDAEEDDLFLQYHSKTRNVVRKALKQGMQVLRDDLDVRTLHDIHQENMMALRGNGKGWDFFSDIQTRFQPGVDFKIYYALIDGKKIAGLLLFFFNRTVEYYTPVIKQEYRSLQPLSLLIHQAMLESMKSGWAFWNWGGTWDSQEDLLHFKERWGGVETEYQYFSSVTNKSLLEAPVEKILSTLPGFFVKPFNK